MNKLTIPILLAALIGFSACGSPKSETEDPSAKADAEEMVNQEEEAIDIQAESEIDIQAESEIDIQEEAEVLTMENGLQIQVIAEGEGEGLTSGQFVRVHYTGWLYDENAPDGRGDKFDSSRDRGQTFDYQHGVTSLIAGWTQGSEGMKTGERRILTIPSELGYGPGGRAPRIPPNAILIFDIELVEIVGQ